MQCSAKCSNWMLCMDVNENGAQISYSTFWQQTCFASEHIQPEEENNKKKRKKYENYEII